MRQKEKEPSAAVVLLLRKCKLISLETGFCLMHVLTFGSPGDGRECKWG